MIGEFGDWLPYAMLLILGIGIVLDSLYLARRDRQWAEANAAAPQAGGGTDPAEQWHRENRAMLKERKWHEKNRELAAKKDNESSRPAASVSAATSPDSRLVAEKRPVATLWRPWLVLTSLIFLSGIVVWLVYPRGPMGDAVQQLLEKWTG